MFALNEMPIDRLKALISLDAETGLLTWNRREPESFKTKVPGYDRRASSRWNTMIAGTEALRGDCNGYKRGLIDSQGFNAHRVVWALHYGEWCNTNIDHINGDKTDNRPVNLRAAAHEANSRNQKLRRSNTSGVMGVSAHSGGWIVRINADGERKYLGKFSSFPDAVAARLAAEAQYGYDPTHGRPDFKALSGEWMAE
jgi:hypothetical protein